MYEVLLLARLPGLQLLEEVVALVIDEDEGGEVLDLDLPDGLHAEFGILHALDALDAALGEHGSDAADGAEIETAMLLAGLGDDIAAVALGNHHQRGTIGLELIDVGVHAVGRRGTHGATGVALGSLGGSGIEHGVLLEVFGHALAGIQTGLQLGMGNVTGHDDGALQVDTGRDGILAEFLAHGIDTLVEVDDDALLTLTSLGILGRNQFGGIGVHLLQPDAVAVDLGLDVTVGRTADTHTDGTRGTMARQTDDTDVVGQGLAAKLGTEANLMGLVQEFLLEVDVAEGTTRLVARGGQRVVVLNAGELHRQQVLLGRGTADDEGDMVGRTGRRTQRLHLLHQEGQQGALVLDGGLGHGIEVGLVGRATTLGDHDEAVLGTLRGLDVALGGQVATGVHLVIHIQRGILRIAQVVLSEGVEDTQRQGLLVLETRPYLLAFLTMDDGRAGILTEGQDATGCHLGIAQELQSDILVVLRGLGVVEDGSHLLVMFTAQHELHIVEGLLGQKGQGLLGDLDDFLTFKLGGGDTVLGQQSVLGLVFAHLKHRGVLECYWVSHNRICLLVNHLSLITYHLSLIT